MIFISQGYDAIESLRAAFSVSPDNLPLHIHLAATLSSLGQFGEAEQEYRESLWLDPNNADLKVNLGHTYYQNEKTSEAMVIVEDLVVNAGEKVRCLQRKIPRSRSLHARQDLINVGLRRWLPLGTRAVDALGSLQLQVHWGQGNTVGSIHQQIDAQIVAPVLLAGQLHQVGLGRVTITQLRSVVNHQHVRRSTGGSPFPPHTPQRLSQSRQRHRLVAEKPPRHLHAAEGLSHPGKRRQPGRQRLCEMRVLFYRLPIPITKRLIPDGKHNQLFILTTYTTISWGV